jgi:ribonuclease HI
MTVHAFTDGAARGNPGHGGIGVVLKDQTGKVLAKEKDYLGKVTNNVAEYAALLACIEKVKALLAEKNGFTCSRLVIHSDSELLVRQMNGEYKVKNRVLKEFFGQVQDALQSAQFEFAIKHIPREKNREADALANESIDEQMH